MYHILHSYNKVEKRKYYENHKEEKIQLQYCTVFIVNVSLRLLLQDESSVSTYINIILYDTKHYRCYTYYQY